MAEEARAESVQDVDVFVSVGIKKTGTFGANGDDLVDHFLPRTIEPRSSAWISVPLPEFLRQRFRLCSPRVVPLYQVVEELSLTRCHVVVAARSIDHRSRAKLHWSCWLFGLVL